MANKQKSGLGRSLNSLLGNNKPGNTGSMAPIKAPDRDRVLFKEDEVLKEIEQNDIVSRETSIKESAIKIKEANSKAGNGIRESGNIAANKPERIILESDVSRETLDNKLDLSNKSEDKTSTTHDLSETKQDIQNINNTEEDTKGFPQKTLPINFVQPNPNQPRTNFDKEKLTELSDSIKKDGILQPLLVRDQGDGTYQIIAGERRWQAAKIAGLKDVPVVITQADDNKALELAMIENIQRSDLNPIEEAWAYKRMMERSQLTQAELAKAVSKGRSTIANALRLLDLPEKAQELMFDDKITAGHARAILSVPTKEGKENLTSKIVEKHLSVRETENIARLLSANANRTSGNKNNSPSFGNSAATVDAAAKQSKEFKQVAGVISDTLDADVKIKTSGGKNRIEIEFEDMGDLRRILDEIVG